MMAVMDRNKWLGKEACVVFADAEKCFEKLIDWSDCLLDMKKCGMRESEIALVMELNKEAIYSIITPYRETNKVRVQNIVKHGTIFGPLLYCENVKESNNIREKTACTYVRLSIGAMIYVDGRNKRDSDTSRKELST